MNQDGFGEYYFVFLDEVCFYDDKIALSANGVWWLCGEAVCV